MPFPDPRAVYVLTDDQDVKLGSLDVQPVVKSLLTEQGLFFNNAFVTTPICCPSRCELCARVQTLAMVQAGTK